MCFKRPVPLKWWERFLLLFKKRQYACDYEDIESTILCFKVLFGKIYFMPDKFTKQNSKTHNEKES